MVLRPRGSWHMHLGAAAAQAPLTSPAVLPSPSAIPFSSTAGSGSGSDFFAIFPCPTSARAFWCSISALGLNLTILPMALADPPLPFLGALLPKRLQGAPSPDGCRGLHQCPTSPLESFSCMCVETFCLRDEAKSRPW